MTLNHVNYNDAMEIFGHDLCGHDLCTLNETSPEDCLEIDSELGLFLETLVDGSSEFPHRHEELKDCMIDIPQPLKKGQRRPSKYARRAEMRTEPKIGRNEPCKCGSGLKFKKCCING